MQSIMDILYLTVVISIIFWVVFLIIPINAYAYKIKDIDVEPQANVLEIYDDNVALLNDDKREDFITNLGVGLEAKYEGKTRSFELRGNINHQLFNKNHNFDNTSEDLTLNFKNEFSKYARVEINDMFIHIYEPRSFQEAFGRTGGRYSYYINNFNLNYTRDITEQFNVSAKYTNEVNEVSRDDLRDSYLNRIGFGADYSLSSETIFSFLYDFRHRGFDLGKSISTNAIATGLRQYITKQLYLDVKTGIDFINSHNQDLNKPLFFVSLTDQPDENTQSTLSLEKEFSTNAYSEDVFNYWQTSGSLIRRLLERLTCSLSGFYGKGKYTTLNITDRLQGVGMALTYDFTKKLKGNLKYDYLKINSTNDIREYTKNRVLLGITLEF